MPARWRRVTTRTVHVMASSDWSPGDLLSLVAARPILVPTSWRPAVDVCETTDRITVTAELAGVVDDDLEIELYPDAVILDGSRPATACGPDAVYHAAQIRHGPFHAEIQLPELVDLDRSDATLEDGLLRLTLPKLDTSGGTDLASGQPSEGRRRG